MREHIDDRATAHKRRAKGKGAPQLGRSLATAASVAASRLKPVKSIGRHAAREYDLATGRKLPKR